MCVIFGAYLESLHQPDLISRLIVRMLFLLLLSRYNQLPGAGRTCVQWVESVKIAVVVSDILKYYHIPAEMPYLDGISRLLPSAKLQVVYVAAAGIKKCRKDFVGQHGSKWISVVM